MKIIRTILNLILSFLLILSVIFIIGNNIVKEKILNKNYMLSKMEETEFYEQVSREIESGFEEYIYQSGLPEDTIENLFTEEIIKNNVNSIIDYVYEGTEITLSDEIVRENLDNKIQDYISSNGINLNSTGKENIKKFEDLIINEYKNNVNVSETMYKTCNEYVDKIENIENKIGTLPEKITIGIITLIILINVTDLLSAINFIGIASLSLGILLKLGVNLIFKNVDIDNLVILANSISNLVKNILKEILYTISDNSTIYIICGAVAILVVSILKNINNVNKDIIKERKPKRR